MQTEMAGSLSHGIVGSLHQDFLLTADGRSHVNLLGGSAAYAAAGARVWSDSVVIFARIGANFPAALLAPLAQAGISIDGVRRLEQPIDHRRFIAYRTLEERALTNPTAHYLRTGNPFPKELLGYVPPPDNPAAHNTDPLQAYRPDDLPQTRRLPDAVHLCPSDYLTQVVLPGSLRAGGTRIITLDPGPESLDPSSPQQLRSLVSGADALLVSEDEAARLFRPTAPGVWEMAEAFGAMGARFIVITRTAGGQCVWDQEARRRWQVPAYPARARDLTGAGDAFAGGFLVGLTRTGDAVEAALHGSISASIAVEGTGPLYALDATPGLADVRLSALRELVRPA